MTCGSRGPFACKHHPIKIVLDTCRRLKPFQRHVLLQLLLFSFNPHQSKRDRALPICNITVMMEIIIAAH